jgi:hypothetical protein
MAQDFFISGDPLDIGNVIEETSLPVSRPRLADSRNISLILIILIMHQVGASNSRIIFLLPEEVGVIASS